MPKTQSSFLDLLAFSASNAGIGALGLTVFVYLPHFYSAGLGLPLAAVGFSWSLVRLVDLPCDALLAILMDGTHSRWGRYRPWLMALTPLTAAALWALFFPPAGAGLAYLRISLLVAYIGFAGMVLASQSWAARLSQEYHARSRLYALMTAVSVFGVGLALAAQITAKGGETTSVHAMGWIVVSLIGAGSLIACIFAREPPPAAVPAGSGVDWRAWRNLLFRPDLLRLFAAQFALNMGPNWMSALYLFYFQLIRGYSPQAATMLLAVFILAGLPGAAIAPALSRRIGKHVALMVFCAAFIAGLALVFVTPQGNPILGVPVMLITGATSTATGLLLSAMLADVGDLVRLEQGRERMGLIFAFNTWAVKLSGAASVGLSFQLLAMFGFRPDLGPHNSASALEALSWLFLFGPFAFYLLAAAIVYRWPITEARHGQILAELALREAQA